MTKEEIISGLQFTIDMFLFDPMTGEDKNYWNRCKRFEWVESEEDEE